jgi:hypothetical protein
MKLGLHDPIPGVNTPKLRLATYIDWTQMPVVPDVFGHYPLIPVDKWGTLGNTAVGDCAVAGPCHQVMLSTVEGPTKTAAPFDDAAALGNYSAITGYDPSQTDANGNNPTDQGTDIDTMATFWVGTGLTDAAGNTHKIVAYMDMNPGDLRELWLATYLFQSVGMGFALPQSALDQTQAHQVWDVSGDSTIVGGHYVPNFGRAAGVATYVSNPAPLLGVGLTWGLPQPFTAKFYQTYNNQGLVALSEEGMVKAQDIDGFNDALLRADFADINQV